MRNHQKKCLVWKNKAAEGVDYVECKICGVFGRSITSHIKTHDLSKTEYEEKYGPTVCSNSKTKYSETGNYDWINREKAKVHSEKYEAWKANLGEKISEGIMNSDSAREARRQNLSSLNRTDEFRERSSRVAKKTSSRKDILQKRSNQLKEWRKNNPDEFYEKCTSVMINSWKSKPELALFEIVKSNYPAFKKNQQLRRVNKFKTTKSGKRQIDIMSLDNKIIIEFDGVHHFKNIHGKDVLEKNKSKDKELNSVMVTEGWTVIRVSYDQYSYKSGEGFKSGVISRICELIESKERGLFLLGEAYKNVT